jgi:hypothetical protein
VIILDGDDVGEHARGRHDALARLYLALHLLLLLLSLALRAEEQEIEHDADEDDRQKRDQGVALLGSSELGERYEFSVALHGGILPIWVFSPPPTIRVRKACHLKAATSSGV